MYVAQLSQENCAITLLVTVQQYTSTIDRDLLGHPVGGHITKPEYPVGNQIVTVY